MHILDSFRQIILASNRLSPRRRADPNRLNFFMVDSVGKRRLFAKVVIIGEAGPGRGEVEGDRKEKRKKTSSKGSPFLMHRKGGPDGQLRDERRLT